jgi:hypothetical protein
MLANNLIRNHRIATLPLSPRINDYIVARLHTEAQQNPMSGHRLFRTPAERPVIQNRTKESARLRWMKQSECNCNLWRDKAACSKSVAKVVEELVPPTRQETNASSQAMPPTGLTNNLCPVNRIRSE